jgi:transposase
VLDRHDLTDAEWVRLEPLLPDRMRGPVRVRSARVEEMESDVWRPAPRPDGPPRVIEGEVA